MRLWVFSALWLLWLGAVLGGFIGLESYAHTPGSAAFPGPRWPGDSCLAPPFGQPVLVVMAHPHCSCSRATIHALARLMARCRYALTAYVLFYTLKSAPSGWQKTDLYTEAAAIPGVQVFGDEDGSEPRRFKAKTSGQTMLYSAWGFLLFSGGITSARGHEGDSLGQSLIVEALRQRRDTPARVPVFGCALF